MVDGIMNTMCRRATTFYMLKMISESCLAETYNRDARQCGFTHLWTSHREVSDSCEMICPLVCIISADTAGKLMSKVQCYVADKLNPFFLQNEDEDAHSDDTNSNTPNKWVLLLSCCLVPVLKDSLQTCFTTFRKCSSFPQQIIIIINYLVKNP